MVPPTRLLSLSLSLLMNYWESSSFPMEIPHLPADKVSPSDTASGSRAQSCLPGSPEVQSLDGFLPVTFSGPEGKPGLRSHSQGSPSSRHVSK